LQTATRNPARFLGREKDLGTVEKGKLADLVLLDANPLEDIGNTRKIYAVIYRGKVYPRPALDEMLAKVQALAGATKQGVGHELLHTLAGQGVEAAIAQYRRLKSTQPADYDFGEEQLNLLGYSLIQKKKFTDAIKILQLNVEAYPHSANVYDSLGEAYLDNGENELAAKNYRRSLELNPANSNAMQLLKRLPAGPPPSATESK
jgi:tetratricopeptide (TPR) repeat protein